ncbi:hypothetical protein SS1G_09504 [Sclerotinia sclerotiorum 1980 UF-70]|uniref:Uncharacterized protein n=2 Tax=Sclerotinia sclerotiorum (strain ATCC 18683 / 1980 / Ss-1) TaxID=665079 RepID=A7EVZ5_SCLS1|nr:hypothetical protein SS1G_09504 [Sclerotinia sclerotiorum 1980 UF-70]APA15678.1 hypothetical protein sscle_15g104480 [Sclerotinia sclerotiorum 1980 UF-70]EDN93637.1 hypothetical protein SS1G_09504 [Sclerotinia sclerotiorum 1980 UF-70]
MRNNFLCIKPRLEFCLYIIIHFLSGHFPSGIKHIQRNRNYYRLNLPTSIKNKKLLPQHNLTPYQSHPHHTNTTQNVHLNLHRSRQPQRSWLRSLVYYL